MVYYKIIVTNLAGEIVAEPVAPWPGYPVANRLMELAPPGPDRREPAEWKDWTDPIRGRHNHVISSRSYKELQISLRVILGLHDFQRICVFPTDTSPEDELDLDCILEDIENFTQNELPKPDTPLTAELLHRHNNLGGSGTAPVYGEINMTVVIKEPLRAPFTQLSELSAAVDDWAYRGIKKIKVGRRHGDISVWGVSQIKNMSYLFAGIWEFNGDISAWDVSNVEDMTGMFQGAATFDEDLSRWNVSNVTNMGHMFEGAKLFKSDISEWDVSRVIDMRFMFSDTKNFNSNIVQWDVSNVVNFRMMFADALGFKRDMGAWLEYENVRRFCRRADGLDLYDGLDALYRE